MMIMAEVIQADTCLTLGKKKSCLISTFLLSLFLKSISGALSAQERTTGKAKCISALLSDVS